MPESEPDKKVDTVRHEDFVSLYANNVAYEQSVWDLRMLFGNLDQAKSVIEQHTAMALAWPTAKIAAYYMTVNVMAQQAQLGSIALRSDVIPKRPNPNDPDVEPHNRAIVTYLGWIHDQFFGSNPYVPPEVAEEMKKQAESS